MELKEIKSIPIMDVAQKLGLKIKGRSAHCFAHQPDRNPSLRFNIEKNTFRCYVCPQIGGSVIDLVMQKLNVRFQAALEYLSGGGTPLPKRSERKKPSNRPMIGLMEKNEILQSLLSESPLDKEGVSYLTGRGIDIEIAREKGVGFLWPEDYTNVFWRMSRRFGHERLMAAGLTRFYLFAKEGLSFLLFPYLLEGRVHAIKGRCLLTKEEAKERGVKRFVITDRAEILYNQEILKTNMTVYLCEGEIDTLTLAQAGYPAVGIPGTGSFDESWFNLFVGKRVVLCLDPDPAGEKTSAYLTEEFSRRGIAYLKLDLPNGKDVNECYLEKKEGTFAQR
ncbi:MAG: toprim domain-containing protein [Candidatus Manganitrophaceae bacterium]